MTSKTAEICDGCGNTIEPGNQILPINRQRFHGMECALRFYQAKRIKTDNDDKLIRELLRLRSYGGGECQKGPTG